MKIYINKYPSLSFWVKKSDHYKIFRILIVENKPILSGGWGKGGFGGTMSLNKIKLWSLFLRELKEAIVKDNIQIKDIN